jgi:hypothetical protein
MYEKILRNPIFFKQKNTMPLILHFKVSNFNVLRSGVQIYHLGVERLNMSLKMPLNGFLLIEIKSS